MALTYEIDSVEKVYTSLVYRKFKIVSVEKIASFEDFLCNHSKILT